MLDQLLLEEIGQRLAKKPFQDNSWKQLFSYIQVSPSISEGFPLWQLDNDALENRLKLFGLKPTELEQEIKHYRKKSRFMQWLLRLFTRINKKIIVWSYYQQCLSFRELEQQKEALHTNQRDINVESIQPILKELLTYLLQDIHQFENFIGRHIGRFNWIEDKFLLYFQEHIRKQEIGFFELLNKELNILLSTEDEKLLFHNTIRKEYKIMKELISNFTKSWVNGVIDVKKFLGSSSSKPTGQLVKKESSDKPSTSTNSATNSSAALESDNSLNDIDQMFEWLELRRKGVSLLLAQADSADKGIRIQLFLEASFQQLRAMVELRMARYQTIIDEVQSKRQNYQEVIERSETLQNQLNFLFKKGLLLFHPDKCQSEDRMIQEVHKEIFVQFYELQKTTIKKLIEGTDCIRGLVSTDESRFEEEQRQRNESLNEHLQELEALYKRFKEEIIAVHEQGLQGIVAAYAERNAMYAETRAQYAGMRAQCAGIETKIEELEKKVTETNRLPKQNQEDSENKKQATESTEASYSSSPKSMR